MLRLIAWLLLTAAAFLPLAVPAQDAASGELATIKESELEEVRRQISELKQRMDRRAAERDRVTAELKAAEVEIGTGRRRLATLEDELAASTARSKELNAAIASRERELGGHIDQLSAQARAAYMSGGQERLRLLLNQRDPASLGRQLRYYRYLADYRAANIETVRRRLDELSSLREDAASEAARLAELAREQEAALAELTAAQDRRRELVARLDARLEADGNAIEQLAAEERDLARLIAELASILSDYPITSEDPFSALRGKLTWPVAGRIVHDFGDARAAGELKWNGVVVAAPRGREVRAVYHGRVVFADWLAGMGLLVIVDHGEGYLTLYGYNETLHKSPGDWVAPGDVIATVGDSGGQAQAGLYFEVRRGTTPVNPRVWVSRQPKTG